MKKFQAEFSGVSFSGAALGTSELLQRELEYCCLFTTARNCVMKYTLCEQPRNAPRFQRQNCSELFY